MFHLYDSSLKKIPLFALRWIGRLIQRAGNGPAIFRKRGIDGSN